MDNFYLHEQIKNENLKNQRKQEISNKLSNILIIVLFPILLILYIIIALGTKKER